MGNVWIAPRAEEVVAPAAEGSDLPSGIRACVSGCSGREGRGVGEEAIVVYEADHGTHVGEVGPQAIVLRNMTSLQLPRP